MRLRVRQKFCCAILILYGAISLSGDGLHALSGFGGHGCCSQPAVGNSSAQHDHGSHNPHDDHAHLAATDCAGPGSCHPSRSGAPAPVHDPDTCAICQFWILAQSPAPPPPEISEESVVPLWTGSAGVSAPLPVPRLYDSRGPPLRLA
jgi:hypothetical protein